jgi:hypothetical protein
MVGRHRRKVWSGIVSAYGDAASSSKQTAREVAMSDVLAPLTLDFLAWLAAEPRDYVDVMDAWRTSCPRLTVWEDAIDADLVTRVQIAGQPIRIKLTRRGQALLAASPR